MDMLKRTPMKNTGIKYLLSAFLAAGLLAGCEKKVNDAAVSQTAIATNGNAPAPGWATRRQHHRLRSS